MASMVGYDINAKPNGMALPTFKNPYPASLWGCTGGAGDRQYGKLDGEQMQRVANWVMQETKLQWHVGHHAFEQQIDWDVEEFGEDSEMPHSTSYDNRVLEALYELWQAHSRKPFLCEEGKDEGRNLKADLDALSAKIEGAILKFQAGVPWESHPYFVSQRAANYAASQRRRFKA